MVTEFSFGYGGGNDTSEVILRGAFLPSNSSLLMMKGFDAVWFSFEIFLFAQVNCFTLRRFPDHVHTDVGTTKNLRSILWIRRNKSLGPVRCFVHLTLGCLAVVSQSPNLFVRKNLHSNFPITLGTTRNGYVLWIKFENFVRRNSKRQ